MTDKGYRVEHVASKPATNLHKNHKRKMLIVISPSQFSISPKQFP